MRLTDEDKLSLRIELVKLLWNKHNIDVDVEGKVVFDLVDLFVRFHDAQLSKLPKPPEDLEKGLHNILDAWLVCPNPDEIIERDILSLIQPLISQARADTAREIFEEIEKLRGTQMNDTGEFYINGIDQFTWQDLKSRWEGE